jgi:predicted ATPase/DNA-binding SARP family transcriptional activator
MARLSLGLLGAVQVSLDSAAVTSFDSDKVRALLVYLAVEAHQPHRRETLVGLLWPESAEGAARRSLNQALYNLRQSIGDQTATPPYLHIHRDALQFNTASDHALDVATFAALLDTCDTHEHQRIEGCRACAQRLQQAATLYRGSFLEQFFVADSAAFEEWMLLKREALHRRALHSLAQLAGYHEEREEYEAARRYAARQLELDPWREEAHRQLMRVLAFNGERSAALAQYETCRRVLADELGAEPAEETLALYRQIQAGELQAEHLARGPAHIDNLPQALTPFVGRSHEVAELIGLLADPTCRLLTLVGPGGIGKTRLALQVAAQHRAAFAHGVAFVPLAAITSASLLVPSIADALGFAFYGSADPTAQLLNYLREKQLLLLLDNAEQLLDGLALLPQVLQHAPDVKLLLTSREPLTLPGEWVFEVAGLALRADDQTHESDAAALFVQRARRAQVGFVVSEAERREVARICRMVDGMPLALELAAAWVRTLSCIEIAQEIQRNLDFLATSARELEARHRSVRAVFDQSWQALADTEQQVLRCLGVFRGGFTRAAAEQVAGATLGVLSALVAKSLVHRSAEGRYDLHELVRQYVGEQLAKDPPEQAATYARFSHYYVDWLQRQEAPLFSVEQRATFDLIASEMDNVRAALDWAATHQQWASLDKSLGTLSWFYELRNRLEETVAMLEQWIRALRQADSQAAAMADHQVALGHTLAVLSWSYLRLRQFGRAQAASEESLGLLRAQNAPHALADALFLAGALRIVPGEYAECEQYVRESLHLERALGRDVMVARCYYFLGYAALEQSRLAEARMHVSEALRLLKATGETFATIRNQVLLTTIVSAQGELAEAERLAHATLALNRTANDPWSEARMLTELGVLALRQGQPTVAQRQLRKSITVMRELGEWWYVAQALNQLGEASSRLGDDSEAQRCFLEGCKTAVAAQALPVALEALAGMAAVRVRAGASESALELLTQILGHPSSSQETKARAEQLRALLERQLSPEQIKAADARARAKSFEAIVQETLSTG